MLSKKMALRSAAPIKDNMALVVAAKEETAKANRKKMQLPTRLVSVDLCLRSELVESPFGTIATISLLISQDIVIVPDY